MSHATAFHLAVNGLVERMPRLRQAAIMWQAQEHLTEALPLVLGMRMAFKDLQASVSELVYGEPLRIPGEHLAAPPTIGDLSELITQLRHHFEQLRAVRGTSRLTRFLRTQGPSRFYSCLLPAGCGTAPPLTALQ